jgi:hypothetical protein
MNYRVIWRKRVADGLEQLTFLAFELGQDAVAISRSVAEIELRLSDNPVAEGESRDGPERVLIVHPLSATFEVFEATQLVLIYEVVVYPRRRV